MPPFTSIPTIDLSLLGEPERRPEFLKELRDAVHNAGMFYISNPPIDHGLMDLVKEECESFFSLPTGVKQEIDISSGPSFLGYTALGTEETANITDWREHLTISNSVHSDVHSGPPYRKLLGANQWPDRTISPSFKPVLQKYLNQVCQLHALLRGLIATAIGVDPALLESFFQDSQHSRLRLMKYPEIKDDSSQQSLGVHRDSSFSTIVFQSSSHKCLQAQDSQGHWVECPPIPGTLVFLVGQAFEALTFGACKAPFHKVVPPQQGTGARYSVTVFTYPGFDFSLEAEETQERLAKVMDGVSARFSVDKDLPWKHLMEGGKYNTYGMKVLSLYIRSHPEAAQKWVSE